MRESAAAQRQPKHSPSSNRTTEIGTLGNSVPAIASTRPKSLVAKCLSLLVNALLWACRASKPPDGMSKSYPLHEAPSRGGHSLTWDHIRHALVVPGYSRIELIVEMTGWTSRAARVGELRIPDAVPDMIVCYDQSQRDGRGTAASPGCRSVGWLRRRPKCSQIQIVPGGTCRIANSLPPISPPFRYISRCICKRPCYRALVGGFLPPAPATFPWE
jgi:hypothetical protein